MRNASSSLRSIMSANARRNTSARSRGGVDAQPGCAVAAADTAAATSSAPARGTDAISSPVDGFSTANEPAEPPVHLPSTNISVGVPVGSVMSLACHSNQCTDVHSVRYGQAMRADEMRDGGAFLGTALDEFTELARDMHKALAGRIFRLFGPAARPAHLLHDAIATTAYAGSRVAVRTVPA